MQTAVVVGAGFIGAEVAGTARQLGLDVTLIWSLVLSIIGFKALCTMRDRRSSQPIASEHIVTIAPGAIIEEAALAKVLREVSFNALHNGELLTFTGGRTLPIAFGVNIEFLTREISVGAPASPGFFQ